MNQLLIELEKENVDVKEALARFMNNETLYIKFLNKFLADTNFINLEEAVAQNNTEDGLKYAHTLKGLTGNLSLTPLYSRFSNIVSKYRAEDIVDLPDMIKELKDIYVNICKIIKDYQ